MRILSVYVYPQNQHIKLQIEIIKNLSPKEEEEDYSGPYRLSTTESLAFRGYRSQKDNFSLKMPLKQSNEPKEDYTVRTITFELPDQESPALYLIDTLDRICKTAQCDYVLTSNQCIADKLSFSKEDTSENLSRSSVFSKAMTGAHNPPLLYESNTPLMQYVDSKQALPNNISISEFVVDEIIKLNSSLNFLEALKLLNPEIAEDKKIVILNQITHYMLEQDDPELHQKFMGYLKCLR